MKNRIRFIPSLFTILNLFCGFLSIVNASNGNFEQACLFILYAALFDVSDGIVARLTGTSSKFGVELDSLADLISFGAAPSLIFYKFHFFQIEGLGIALSSFIMIFAALRLARFNTQLAGFDKTFFTGVPVPVSAITVSSFFLFYYNKNFPEQTSDIFAVVLSLTLPALMVSKFKYDTMPNFSLRELKQHPVKYVVLLIIVILIIATKGEGLFAFCLFYLSTGILRGFNNFFRKHILKKKRGLQEDLNLNSTN